MTVSWKLGVDISPIFFPIGKTGDYLDDSLQKLVFSRLGNSSMIAEMIGDNFLLKVNSPISPNNVAFELSDAFQLLNEYLKNNNLAYFGIKSYHIESKNTVLLTSFFKNKYFLNDLLHDLMFSYYKEDIYSGMFFPKKNVLYPNMNHSLWNNITPFNLHLCNSPPSLFKKMLENQEIDISCPSQFDFFANTQENYQLLEWELPLVITLILGPNLNGFPVNGLKDKLSAIENLRFHNNYWPFHNSTVLKENIIPNVNTIELLYTNFYPNYKIALILKQHLDAYGIGLILVEVDYRSFINYKPKENQIKLSIIAATNQNPVLFYIKLLSLLNKKQRAKCSDILNNYLLSNTKQHTKVVEMIEHHLIDYQKIIPLGTMQSRQWIRPELVDQWKQFVELTNFGLLRKPINHEK